MAERRKPDPTSSGDRSILEAAIPRSAPAGLTLEADRFIGAFYPHASKLYQPGELENVWSRINSRARGHLEDSHPVIFVFEDVSKTPAAMAKDLSLLFVKTSRPPKAGPSINQQDVLATLSLGQADDLGEADFDRQLMKLFFDLRNIAGLTADGQHRVWGFFEQPFDRADPLRPHLIGPAASPQAEVRRFTNLIAHIVNRDLKLAAEILEVVDDEPEALLVVERGMLHLGLVPAMQVLSEGRFPKVNLSTTHRVKSVMRLDGSLAPLLWQKRFWAEIIGDNSLTVRLAQRDTSSVLRRYIGEKVRRDWIYEILQQALADFQEAESHDHVITLIQR